jgi:predicted pyridoxine 5'-phosphate oxidase superfamily flavin-nucleotide-binding protein
MPYPTSHSTATIPAHVIDLLQTGVSIVVGTRDASLVPECTRAWGIRVSKDGKSVTIFLTETMSRKTIQNLRENGQVAMSCARPTDHMACQLKGRLRAIRPAGVRDRECRNRWGQDFRGELMAIGVPAPLFDALIRDPALAIDIDVTEVFHQTPGPGAGEKV